MKVLEGLINEIKTKGFEKCRNEIDLKLNIKQRLETSIDNLQKKVNFVNSQQKHYGTKNSKFEYEMDMFKSLADRWQHETYQMKREMPSIKTEMREVS